MVRSRKDPASVPTALPEAKAADAVDAQLARYQSMRDFRVTSEPSGSKGKKRAGTEKLNALPFVIQKHAATRLHYDFRLGWNGVLKSWAVAKGPSYNVHDRRLAVEVEDHPMEYGGFEGIIPRGQYGGGTVMVWDQGTWEPLVDVEEGLRKGNLKFALNGTKMHGHWALVRMGGKAAHEGKPNWLLIKEHDEFERPPEAPCITEESPASSVTARSLEEIAAAETHVWNSKETAGEGKAWYRQRAREADAQATPTRRTGANRISDVRHTSESAAAGPDQSSLAEEALPEFIKPQLASEAENPPSTSEWLHELKLDGYRIQARKRGRTVQLLTRTGLDWTHRMKPIHAAVLPIPADEALLDGEVVVLDDSGVSSFAKLQASFEKGETHPLTYFVFDLLHLNGRNTRNLPLRERRDLLQGLIGEDTETLRISEALDADGEKVFHAACELHAEGIISKRADSPYTSGRGHVWVKSKCLHEQEFVVGGFTDLSNGTRGIGALLLGYYDDRGGLIYAGRAGTGFTQKIHRMLRDKVESIEQKSSPFVSVPGESRRGAHWVAPELVVQVRFATWTSENQLRQAAYLGLREDKPAAEVRKEEAAPTPKKGKQGRPAANANASETRKPPAQVAAFPAIRLTHPQKVVDAASGITKQQLAQYLFAVSERMLPHIADRPLSLVRCPDGSAKPCFYQKHVNHMLPVGVSSVMVADKKGGVPEPYITLNTAEALTGLAQMTVLEIHPWGSCNEDLERPNRITIDLDPDELLPWRQVCESALEIRGRLKKLGLESFVKTTGGKGLHVVFPLKAEHDFSVIKAWAHGFVQTLERDDPRLYLTRMTKAARTGKIYLDYLRNERGATAVAPYSMRARPNLPVSVPLDWKELQAEERPQFRVNNFDSEWKQRLRKDPWKRLATVAQQLTADVLAQFITAQARQR